MISTKNKPVLILLVIIVVVIAYVLIQNKRETTSQQGSGLDIDVWYTNGTRVMYVYAPELPMVDIRLVFHAGSAHDGDNPGLASMTNLLLDNGAGGWDTNQIEERFDSVGAQFETSSLREMAIVGLRSLTEKEWLQTALDTMAAVLQKPRFDQAELDRERKRVLVALRNQEESPGEQAELAFYKALYQDHPYAIPSLGTRESISAMTRDDLLAFYKKYYVANNAIVVIVGAVDKNQARQIVRQLVKPLPTGEAAPLIPEVAGVSENRVIRKQHPSSQTTIWVGQEGNYRGDPDYFPLYVGNHILGGSGFGSRIMQEIRESRGLAYSSYSYFSPMQRKGPFLMGLQTKNDQAEEALQVLMQTVNKFIEQGPTEEELEHAKKNITGGFPLKLDSNKDILSYVAMIGFYDLPLDYLKNFNHNVEQVTIQQIKDAFQRRIHPDKMVTVMVGDIQQSGKATAEQQAPKEDMLSKDIQIPVEKETEEKSSQDKSAKQVNE